MTQSNVGSSGVYEAGDQRNAPQSEQHDATRFEEGKEHSHQALDSSMCFQSLSIPETIC